ncbi:MAG: exonuclease SbcCD subunit D C-terminal domain-containing protein [Deltaproteobacteria bacterium]|nr:exonuclease SbcCD subunit D C-terminal domain-containing protein [Deltaproteobacteria bacterium]
MRLLHTSDWHLGHMLRGEVAREHEHAAFVKWLLATCVREAADVLVITGDVFDSATPSASAERMWFDFLAAARRARPAMDIVAIAGNHDSPARLGAASSILRELAVHVIGALPRCTTGIDLDRVLIPVAGGRGLIAAVPFLRPADLPADAESALDLIYGEVIAGARARRRPDQALIVTGHLYVAGAEAPHFSERRVSIGGQESAPLRLFPDDIDYVALGHIHRAQGVGRDSIRYAGAPLALSLDESWYPHQIVAIDFDGGRTRAIRSLPVPRTVEIVRVPKRGSAPMHEVLGELDLLPALRVAPESPARPYLEVVVSLDAPQPRLRTLIEDALEGKHARLITLHVEHTGDRGALAERVSVLSGTQRLAELDPREVFERLWARDHSAPPDPGVLAAFERLLASVRGDREDPAGEPR